MRAAFCPDRYPAGRERRAGGAEQIAGARRGLAGSGAGVPRGPTAVGARGWRVGGSGALGPGRALPARCVTAPTGPCRRLPSAPWV